jgi:hypothetical protein
MALLGRRVGFGRRMAWCVSASIACASLAACMSRLQGERAKSGECPVGETCSEATLSGLHFVGNAFWDETQLLRLGPVLVGGTFDIGIQTVDGEPLPDFALQAEDPSVFQVERGQGVFGPTFEGEALYPVDGHLRLTGKGAGTTMIRVVDRTTGELFDRIAIEAYEIEDIAITNMDDPDRQYVLAGCEELLAVRLLAKGGGDELRAFDQSVQLRAEGTVRAETNFWDCFAYRAPEGRVEVEVEVVAGGKTFTKALEVRTLAEVELKTCPERRSRD